MKFIFFYLSIYNKWDWGLQYVVQNSILQIVLLLFNCFMLLKSDTIECLIIQINETIFVEQVTAFYEGCFICYVSNSCASHG